MLLYFIRGLFVVIIASVLFVGIVSITDESTDSDISSSESQNDVQVIFIGGLSLAIIAALISVFPKVCICQISRCFCRFNARKSVSMSSWLL